MFGINSDEHDRQVKLKVFKNLITQPYDCELKAENLLTMAHRSVLRAVSPFFEKIFKDQEKKSALASIIDLRGLKFDDVNHVLELVYFGKTDIEESRVKDIQEVMELLQITLPSMRHLTTSTEVSGKSSVDIEYPFPVAVHTPSNEEKFSAVQMDYENLIDEAKLQASKATQEKTQVGDSQFETQEFKEQDEMEPIIELKMVAVEKPKPDEIFEMKAVSLEDNEVQQPQDKLKVVKKSTEDEPEPKLIDNSELKAKKMTVKTKAKIIKNKGKIGKATVTKPKKSSSETNLRQIVKSQVTIRKIRLTRSTFNMSDCNASLISTILSPDYGELIADDVTMSQANEVEPEEMILGDEAVEIIDKSEKLSTATEETKRIHFDTNDDTSVVEDNDKSNDPQQSANKQKKDLGNTCQYCSREFKSNNSARRHENTICKMNPAHGAAQKKVEGKKQSTEIEATSVVKGNVCQYCSEKFRSNNSARRHENQECKMNPAHVEHVKQP